MRGDFNTEAGRRVDRLSVCCGASLDLYTCFALSYHPCVSQSPSTSVVALESAASGDAVITTSTVLIVDDNPQNVELLQAFLESLPVKLVTAVDGIDALAKVADHNPDLILLDVMMPRMSGFQVCQKLKSDPKTRDIQILMVTALHELGDIERASECGTDDFVSKPVNKVELQTRVKSLLRVRHLKSELERALTYLNEIEQDDTSAS
jgi:two-component system cell cycle response regulator